MLPILYTVFDAHLHFFGFLFAGGFPFLGCFLIFLGALESRDLDIVYRGIAVTAWSLIIFYALDVKFGLQTTGREIFGTVSTLSRDTSHSRSIVSANDPPNRLGNQPQSPEMLVAVHSKPGSSPNYGFRAVRTAHSAKSLYVYSPLRDQEIRLVHVQPPTAGLNSAGLCCQILTIPLSAAPDEEYIALSYNWGEEVKDEEMLTINVGEYVIKIRPNLYDILSRVRECDRHTNALPAGRLLVWVDAICINQKDLIERGRQVTRMQAVYASATLVLSVIDLAEEDASQVQELMRLAEPALAPGNQRAKLHTLLQERSPVSALWQLCCHPYWTRVWILQEFAVAQPLKLLINKRIVRVENLELVVQTAFEEKFHSPSFHPLQTMLATRKSWQQGSRMSLLSLLLQMSAFECSEQIDRVFGVLGLVHDSMSFLQEPNYERGFEDWTIMMTKSYARKHSLDIILAGAGTNRVTDKIPSWCPDYFNFHKSRPSPHKKRLSQPLQIGALQADRSARGSCKVMGWDATGSTPQQVEFAHHSLFSVARRLGTICSLGAVRSDRADDGFPKHNEDWARKCQLGNIVRVALQMRLASCYHGESPFVSKPGTSPSFISSNEVYVQTHIFHPCFGRSEPYLEVGEDFGSWIHANRKFYTDGATLESHAELMGHPIAWYWNILEIVLAKQGLLGCIWKAFRLFCQYFIEITFLGVVGHSENDRSFVELKRAASSGMRLMCMDCESFGIGWGAPCAELDDEVFLIPGCSVPVILRWNRSINSYEFVGDAIIVGAMQGETWENTGPDDLIRVEIR